MRFTIVIPNYNSGEVLERAIRSVLAQDYPDLQLILADSESTDVSRQIIEKYRSVFDPAIIRKDKGQADGLNHGFAQANGDIFGWLCADDELMPGALHHLANLFHEYFEADVIVGACERIYADGSVCVVPPDRYAWDVINLKDVIDQPSAFWRAELHQRVGPLDTSFHLAFDWDLWCRMRETEARLLTTDYVISRYHFSDTNKSGSSGSLHVKEGYRILRKYGPLGGALAPIFRFLYKRFDLYGCYDTPQTCTRLRGALFSYTMKSLKRLIGNKIYMYNWHFASLQERGLRWW